MPTHNTHFSLFSHVMSVLQIEDHRIIVLPFSHFLLLYPYYHVLIAESFDAPVLADSLSQ